MNTAMLMSDIGTAYVHDGTDIIHDGTAYVQF